MITTRVRVLRAVDGIAWVQASESSGCGACASKSACGVGGYAKLFGRGLISLPYADARAGEELTVQMEDRELLKAGLFAYLLPVLLTLLGAALLAEAGDAASLIGALGGLALGLLLARWLPRAPVLRVEGNPIPSPTLPLKGRECQPIPSPNLPLKGRECQPIPSPALPLKGRGQALPPSRGELEGGWGCAPAPLPRTPSPFSIPQEQLHDRPD